MAKRKTYDDSAAEQDSEEVSSLEESSSEDVLWALPKIESSLAHPHFACRTTTRSDRNSNSLIHRARGTLKASSGSCASYSMPTLPLSISAQLPI